MKINKIKNFTIALLISLIIAVVCLSNLFFYSFGIINYLAKSLWIPLCLLIGLCVGYLLVFLGKKIKKSFPKLKFIYLFLLVGFSSAVIFFIKDIYYIPLRSNSFSEQVINIQIPSSSEMDELLINEIRVDQRSIKWQEYCEITGPYRWVRNQALTLEKKGNQYGELECRFYPKENINIVFQTGSLPDYFVIKENNSPVTYKVVTQANGDFINVNVSSVIIELVPDVLLFFNIFIGISLLVMIWISFLPESKKAENDKKVLWMVAGYLICYGFFFLSTIYFNEQHTMLFPQDVSTGSLIGGDFYWIIDKVQSVILNKQSLAGSYYSPGSFYLFIPFAFMDYLLAYQLYTILKFLLFIISTFLLPVFFISRKDFFLPLFFLLTGLMSFGWKYELERGQGYSLVFGLLFISIWLFHKYFSKKPIRYLAYFLFTISIQMKLTPAIFFIFFIKHWKDIKGNIIRIFGLGLVNLILFFSTGFENGQNFIKSILWIGSASRPTSGMENHSIKSFILWIQSTMYDDITYISNIFLVITIVCLLILVFRYYLVFFRRHEDYFDPLILIGFSLAALLIPNENNDYTLAIIPIILSLGLSMEYLFGNNRIDNFDLFIITLLYSTTIFSNVLKPNLLIIQNNCSVIMLLLIFITITAWKKEMLSFFTRQFNP